MPCHSIRAESGDLRRVDLHGRMGLQAWALAPRAARCRGQVVRGFPEGGRARLCDRPGFTVWFTGLSGAGKTAIAEPLAKALQARGLRVERLDGDTVRQELTSDLGFTKEDRDENIGRVTFVAKLLSRNGVAVICSFISPYRERRAKTRRDIEHEGSPFVEVYVHCPLEVCAARDVKGLYERAFAGEIDNFTGVSDPYESPEKPDVVCRTAEETVAESVARVLAYLEEKGYVPAQ